MPSYENTCPMDRKAVVDTYFMEHRAKLMDIAAFLDRLERATDDGSGDDFRVEALKAGLALVNDGQPERTKRLMLLLSDPTTEPIPSAAGMKGASGVWPRFGSEEAR